MEKRNEKPVCPKCGRMTVLYAKRTQIFWCRQCGHEWSKEEQEKTNQNKG